MAIENPIINYLSFDIPIALFILEAVFKLSRRAEPRLRPRLLHFSLHEWLFMAFTSFIVGLIIMTYVIGLNGPQVDIWHQQVHGHLISNLALLALFIRYFIKTGSLFRGFAPAGFIFGIHELLWVVFTAFALRLGYYVIINKPFDVGYPIPLWYGFAAHVSLISLCLAFIALYRNNPVLGREKTARLIAANFIFQSLWFIAGWQMSTLIVAGQDPTRYGGDPLTHLVEVLSWVMLVVIAW